MVKLEESQTLLLMGRHKGGRIMSLFNTEPVYLDELTTEQSVRSMDAIMAELSFMGVDFY